MCVSSLSSCSKQICPEELELHNSITLMKRSTSTLKPCTTSTKDVSPQPCLCESEIFCQVFECYLEQLIADGEREVSVGCTSGSATPFHALRLPSISPADYTKRLIKFSSCSNASLVATLVFIQRIERNLKETQGRVLDGLSVHRLVLTCLVIAIKALEDEAYDNKHYATVGGLSCVGELNGLELMVLNWLKFDIGVSAEDFERFEKRMVEAVLEGEEEEWSNLRSSLQNMGFAKPGPVATITNAVATTTTRTTSTFSSISATTTTTMRFDATEHALDESEKAVPRKVRENDRPIDVSHCAEKSTDRKSVV